MRASPIRRCPSLRVALTVARELGATLAHDGGTVVVRLNHRSIRVNNRRKDASRALVSWIHSAIDARSIAAK